MILQFNDNVFNEHAPAPAAYVPRVRGQRQQDVGGGDPQSCDWVFTWNNYTDVQERVLRTIGETRTDDYGYLVYGRETGGQGTPHLQGFIQFSTRKRRSFVQRFLNPGAGPGSHIHLEPRRGTPEQAIAYSKKDGAFVEFGIPIERHDHPGGGQGQRSDLIEFVDAIRREGPLSLRQMIDRYPLIQARYPRFAEQVMAAMEEAPVPEMHPLRDWQADLGVRLRMNPDPRKIIFVVDRTGNCGKSWFIDYWCYLHDSAMVLHPARHCDMAYILKQTRPKPKTVFIDCPREKLDYFSYTFLEDLKNGRVLSTKYETVFMKFNAPHVVVMMNEQPDLSKLSWDRVEVITLN